MAGKLLRVFEYDRIDFRRKYRLAGADKDTFAFDLRHQKALEEFHSHSNGVYYSLINQGIRFCEQVGAVQVHDLTIEVLPKIDREDNDVEKWHGILLDMLKACKLLLPKSSQDAQLQLKSNSILELYFQKYVIELEALLHSGLIKKYRTSDGNVKALKGKLLFHKQLQKNMVHAESFFTRHTVYDKSHSLHQVLRQALEVVDKLNSSSGLSDKIKCLLLDWPEGEHLAISSTTFDRIVLNRKSESYSDALSIAKLILLNYHPDIRGGRSQVMALMFNMNNLWEEFIFQRLKQAGRVNNWDVMDQMGLVYWSNDNCKKRLLPDIIIRHKATGKRVIIDTKWKRPQGNRPDDHDLRQIFTYKLYFHADQAFLLYPSSSWTESSGSYYEKGYKSEEIIFKEGTGLEGGLLFVSVLDGKKLQGREGFLDGKLVTCINKYLEANERRESNDHEVH